MQSVKPAHIPFLDLAGLNAEVGINAIAARHRLFVLEDAAQAHGARYRGRRTGTLGNAAAFNL